MGRNFRSSYDAVLRWFVLFFGMLVGFSAFMITLNIFLRLIGQHTVGWVSEVAEYAMYVGAFAAAPWVLRLGLHVKVDIFSRSLPRTAARAVDLLADTASLAVCLIAAYYSAVAAYTSFEDGSMIYKNLVIPEWLLLAVMPISFLLLGSELLLSIATGRSDAAETAPASGGF